mmetsp:Transcript_24316/g.61155  ORF Transcript_24316/g.61155 Transcript_24316/m.61155 type:complete len:215 (-) Transcript_24316:1451-2095(-)
MLPAPVPPCRCDPCAVCRRLMESWCCVSLVAAGGLMPLIASSSAPVKASDARAYSLSLDSGTSDPGTSSCCASGTDAPLLPSSSAAMSRMAASTASSARFSSFMAPEGGFVPWSRVVRRRCSGASLFSVPVVARTASTISTASAGFPATAFSIASRTSGISFTGTECSSSSSITVFARDAEVARLALRRSEPSREASSCDGTRKIDACEDRGSP